MQKLIAALTMSAFVATGVAAMAADTTTKPTPKASAAAKKPAATMAMKKPAAKPAAKKPMAMKPAAKPTKKP
jgi:hypothetical protein